MSLPGFTKSRRIAAAVLLTLLAVFYLGWDGIPRAQKLSAGNCSSSYPGFVVAPFLRNLLQCTAGSDCQVEAALQRYRSALTVTQCLCGGGAANANLVTTFAAKELSAPFATTSLPADAPGICASVTGEGALP